MVPTRYERKLVLNDLGWLVFLATLALIAGVILTIWPAPVVASEPAEDAPALEPPVSPVAAQEALQEAVTAYIRCFVANGRDEERAAWDKRWQRAPELARMIVETAEEHGIDPWLHVVNVRAESSFHEGGPDGTVGEVGLCQVHGKAAQGCDLETSEGQLRCGARWLSSRFEECHTRDESIAFTAYRTGSCQAGERSGRYRARLYRRARARFGAI